MTEQVDLDALEALAKAALEVDRPTGMEWPVCRWRNHATPDIILALIGELRQERERADEAEREAEEITTAWLDKDRQIAEAETALSRAEETIEKVREVSEHAMHPEQLPTRCGVCRIERLLTEYDKRKGSDRD